MSYIGNEPTTVAFLTDQFSGNGSTVAFTMSVAPATTSSILVAVTGVVQDPSTYAISGTTLTFSAAPPSGTGNISVRYLGIPASGVATTAYRTVTEFTATAGQTSFSVPSYTVGYIDVYRNGSRLGTADFTASSGTTVVLAAACTVGDLVTTESFYVSSVLNAIPAVAGAVNSTYIAGGAALANIGAGGIDATYLSTGAPSWNSSGNFQFNSGYGSVATAYGCRAWVNFNGTGTVAIRASGNVSSITDNGTGDYTVNFTTAMPDGNYAYHIGSKQDQAAAGDAAFPTNGTPTGVSDGAAGMTTTRIRLRFVNLDGTASLRDQEVATCSIFR